VTTIVSPVTGTGGEGEVCAESKNAAKRKEKNVAKTRATKPPCSTKRLLKAFGLEVF
jgi:hypothetical protein